MTTQTEAESKNEVEAVDAHGAPTQPMVLQSPFMDQELDVYLSSDGSATMAKGVD